MLPSVPKSLGRLSDAYLSAYLALSSSDNPLKLAQKKSYLVILVDGLGTANIKSAAGHAGFLNQKLVSAKSLFSGFPATTSSSLTSLATGAANGSHAVLGHRVYDRAKSRNINFLNDLGSELDPREYQDLETISEQAAKMGWWFQPLAHPSMKSLGSLWPPCQTLSTFQLKVFKIVSRLPKRQLVFQIA
jgi:hypothetical protein